jgi:hypothetical protein
VSGNMESGGHTVSLLWKGAHMSPEHLHGRASGGSTHLRRRDGCWVGRDLTTSSRRWLGWMVLVEGAGGQVISKTMIIMALCHLAHLRHMVGGDGSNHVGELGK